jgi:hypothetical protein
MLLTRRQNRDDPDAEEKVRIDSSAGGSFATARLANVTAEKTDRESHLAWNTLN